MDPANVFGCTQCDLRFLTYAALMAHKETHQDDVPGEGDDDVEDDYEEDGKDGEKKDAKTHHGCAQCGKYFTSRTFLYRHLRLIHLIGIVISSPASYGGGVRPKKPRKKYKKPTQGAPGEKVRTTTTTKHKCDLCGKSYTYLGKLNNHIREAHNVSPPAESEEARYQCLKCEKNYAFKCNLKKHMKRYHNSNLT